MALALSASASAQSAAPSFAGIFFWSSAAGGGVDWIGTGMIWFLIALSFLSVGLIGKLFLEQDAKSIDPPGFAERIRLLLIGERYREAIDATRDDPSDLARMLHAAFAAAPGGHESMVRAMEGAADDAFAERVRRLERLNTLGQVSPMIGLFGTVYGMIVAFQTIAASGGAADPVMLAGGIGTALVTTFWGLLIAIPALSAYATIRGRVERSIAEAERSAETLLRIFSDRQAVRTAAATANG